MLVALEETPSIPILPNLDRFTVFYIILCNFNIIHKETFIADLYENFPNLRIVSAVNHPAKVNISTLGYDSRFSSHMILP